MSTTRSILNFWISISRTVRDFGICCAMGAHEIPAIAKLGRKLQLRQRAIATATVFFRRFYLKNAYCETDPFLVIAACCYVAAKAEESPVHIKNVVAESRTLFSREVLVRFRVCRVDGSADQYNVRHFPSDNSKLGEMEFYLVDDLECDLTVFHPYRTLMALCKKESSTDEDDETEAGELGVGVSADEGQRYWGSSEDKLEMSEAALQMAWHIINDTYRGTLCLLYPPHLIAIAAIYLTQVFHQPSRDNLSTLLQPPSSTAPHPRRSSRNATESKKHQDPVTFLAELNVSLPLIATISQEIIALYALWDRYKDDSLPDASASSRQSPLSAASGSASRSRSSGTPLSEAADDHRITPAFLSNLLMKMKENRMTDPAHPPTGRVVVNKMLERTQAAASPLFPL